MNFKTRFENELISVKASWIKHRIPTFGFVIEQKPLQVKYDSQILLLIYKSEFLIEAFSCN